MLKHSIVQRELGDKLISFMAFTPLLLSYVAGLVFEPSMANTGALIDCKR